MKLKHDVNDYRKGEKVFVDFQILSKAKVLFRKGKVFNQYCKCKYIKFSIHSSNIQVLVKDAL